MKILITGAAGFLGSHLCEYLIKQGHSVIGMDNFITGSPDNIAHLAGNDNFPLSNTMFLNISSFQKGLMLFCISPLPPAPILLRHTAILASPFRP